MYQRQLQKGQIADMMEGKGGAKGKKGGASSRFSTEELKELFQLRLDTTCDTRDLLQRGHAVPGEHACCVASCFNMCCNIMPTISETSWNKGMLCQVSVPAVLQDV